MLIIKRIVNGDEMTFLLTPEEIEDVRRQDKIQWAKDVLANYDYLMDDYDDIIKDESKLVAFADLLESKNLEDNCKREMAAIAELFLKFPDANEEVEKTPSGEVSSPSMTPEEAEMFFGVDIYKREDE